MVEKIKVTIGLCVKNAESTIREALHSIFEQDFPHDFIELIIVDGYSKDKTLPIIQEELTQTSIKFKIFQENKGIGYARQLVVNNATGDYIIWVDGDMVLPKNFVRTQVEFMEQNPNVGIGKARYGLHSESSLPAILEDVEFVVSFMNPGRVSSKTLGTSGCIYRTKALKQAGGFDENIKKAGEDMDAEYKIQANGWELYVTPAIFYERRRKTWRSLWDEYFWLGYGAYHIFRKQKKLAEHYKMFLPIMLITMLLRSCFAYKLLHRKSVFLLPLHNIFKRTAWIIGFLNAARISICRT